MEASCAARRGHRSHDRLVSRARVASCRGLRLWRLRLTLVSVVTPCLNSGRESLSRCVASVAAQTHSPIEHIVVDGGSTDGTLELLRDLEHVTWASEPDGGQAEALNKGFALANGSIVTWLNADDRLLPDSAARAVAVLDANPDVGWVYGDCILEENAHTTVRTPAPHLSVESFAEGSPVAQPGTFIRASALARVGPIDETFELAMDFDLWLRLVLAGVTSRYVAETLAVFEIHPSSKTGSRSLGDFQREEAIALAKAGLPEMAAATLGRAAANSAAVGGRVEPADLDRSVRLLLPAVPAASAGKVRASARVEAARLERRYGARGYRHLRTFAAAAAALRRRVRARG